MNKVWEVTLLILIVFRNTHRLGQKLFWTVWTGYLRDYRKIVLTNIILAIVRKYVFNDKYLLKNVQTFWIGRQSRQQEYVSKLIFVHTRLIGRQGRPSFDICPNFRIFFWTLPLVKKTCIPYFRTYQYLLFMLKSVDPSLTKVPCLRKIKIAAPALYFVFEGFPL